MDWLLVFFILATTAPQSQKANTLQKKKKKTSEKRAGKGNVQNIGWYQCSVSTYCWSSISSCITSSNLLARLIGRWLTWKSIVAVQKAKKSVNCFLTLESAIASFPGWRLFAYAKGKCCVLYYVHLPYVLATLTGHWQSILADSRSATFSCKFINIYISLLYAETDKLTI